MPYHHDRLVQQYSKYVQFQPGTETYNVYKQHFETLIDPNTKRLLFDSKQALVFSESGEVPTYIQSKLKTPFDQFYMEFTEPIIVGEQEDGQLDYLRAMYYIARTANVTINQPDGSYALDTASIVWLLHGEREGIEWYVERGYQFDLESGLSITRVKSATSNSDASEFPRHWKPNQWIVAGLPIADVPERHIGWWECTVQDYSALFSWLMTYMMAKSVVVVEEPLSRQQRRWFTSHPKLPKPWHIVKVEPKFTSGSEEGSGRSHSYRYDVIGHLRFAHHKLRDGSNYHGIEWIRPHQRGLDNALYIPKTYKVERGKVVSPKMKEYFGADTQQEGV